LTKSYEEPTATYSFNNSYILHLNSALSNEERLSNTRSWLWYHFYGELHSCNS